MDEHTYTWTEWCERFRAALKQLNYTGPMIMSSFHDDWEQDADPTVIAEAFVAEMNDVF